jgi:hypothetical protein
MPRRSRRAVYDPTIENDQLMKTTLFRDDPLAMNADPEDDIRQWSNASNSSAVISKRKWCYIVSAITTVVLMVVVGVAVRNNNNSSRGNTTTTVNSNSGNTPPVAAPVAAPTSGHLLDPPIATLSQLCSRDRVQQADKRGLCEAECAKAACCALDCDTGANVATCQAYENICEILLITEVVPSDEGLAMPPDNLSQVCALDQLMSLPGYQTCETMCQVASCCHLPMSDPTSCNVPYHTECLAYHSVCGVLEHVSAPEQSTAKELDLPSEEIAVWCALENLQTLEGYETCRKACEPASCCTATQESSHVNCFQEYAYECDAYAEPCGALLRVVPHPPDNLPALCGVDQLQTVAGYETCEDICARATCCHEGMQLSCATDPLCMEYQGPCSILETAVKPSTAETPVAANQGVSSNRMHPPPSYISEQCTEENIAASAEGRQRCSDICVEALCCNYPSNLPELSCLAGNEDVCAEYFSYCSLLDGASSGDDAESPMKPPSEWTNEYSVTDIYTACADLSTPDGIQQCHDVCSEARCCYSTGTDSCIDDERCDDFDMCFNYKALSYIHEDIPTLIANNCADLESLEGLELCEASCEQAVCCFAEGDALDCEGLDLTFCSQYAACEVLVRENPGDPDQMPDLIGKNCDDLVTLKGIQVCQALCEPAVCCYTNDNTIDCQEEDLNVCGFGYQECENLFDLAVEDRYRISNLVEQNCADLVSLEGRELCEASCKPAICCFVDGATNDCEGRRLSYCGQYQACAAFFENDEFGEDENDVITVPDNEPSREQIELACQISNLNYEACLTLCDKGRCCWNSDETICSSGIDCSTYDSCAILV